LTRKRGVILRNAEPLYDSLISCYHRCFHHYFGNDDWATVGFLKTVEDVLEMRRRILFAFEAAEKRNC